MHVTGNSGWSEGDIVAALTLLTTWISIIVAILGLYIRALINKSELKGNTRHQQNLARFRWLCVALARMGYSNGEMPTFDDG